MNCAICGKSLEGEMMAISITAYDQDNEVIGATYCCDDDECCETYVEEYVNPQFPDDEEYDLTINLVT